MDTLDLPRPSSTTAADGAPRRPATGVRLPRFAPECHITRLRAGAAIGVVRPGQRFLVETLNAFGQRLPDVRAFEAFMQGDERKASSHPCVGPIEVEGAGRGCSLRVAIRRVEVQQALTCLSVSTGVLAGTFPGRQPQISPRMPAGFAALDGLLLRQSASVGVVATLDDQDRSPGRCSSTGGNLDLAILRSGACIYLPVNHGVAQLAIGDLHFRQGAGEVSGMGLETDGLVELEVALAEYVPYPVIDTPEVLAVVGWGDEPLAAARCAAENAIDYLARWSPFSRWPRAAIYQLLGGVDLVPGNLTGRVATSALVLPKRDFLDPVRRHTVIPAPATPARPGVHPGPDDVPVNELQRRLLQAIADFDSLPVVSRGDSREIRALPERHLLVARLLPTVYSWSRRGAIPAPGSDRLRAAISDLLNGVLTRAGIATSTLKTAGAFVLLRNQRMAHSIEVVVKTRFGGSCKHRYRELPLVTTRFGGTIPALSRHDPYVRFDWRNCPPGEDEPLPEALANHFVDVGEARATVLRSFEILGQHLRERELDLVDGCFFISEDGRVLCGELSPDNLTIEYLGQDATLRATLLDRQKQGVVDRLRVVARLLGLPVPGDAGALTPETGRSTRP